MSEFEKLIDAARRGDVQEIEQLVGAQPELINKKDATGATALHYAAFAAHRPAVQFLVRHGAEVNVRDDQFGATPTGWAIEYLRELGGFLGIELEDLAFAIRRGDVEWVARFLTRFPALGGAKDAEGTSFGHLAEQCGNPQIVRLFATHRAR